MKAGRGAPSLLLHPHLRISVPKLKSAGPSFGATLLPLRPTRTRRYQDRAARYSSDQISRYAFVASCCGPEYHPADCNFISNSDPLHTLWLDRPLDRTEDRGGVFKDTSIDSPPSGTSVLALSIMQANALGNL